MASVWPYVPMPQIDERLSWLTVAHRREDDVSRWSLRPTPRQVFGLQYAFLSARWEEAKALFEGNVLGLWEVPCWAEATRGVAVDAADTVLTVETNAEYFANTKAIVWGDCDTYTVVTVSSVGSGTITLSGSVGATYASALVMPLRTCFVRGGMDTSRTSANHYQASIQFEATDNEAIPSTLTEFSSYPYFPCSGAVISAHGGRIERSAVFVDSGMGPVSIEPSRSVVEELGTVTVAASTPENRWAIKQALHAAAGRDAPFWVTEKVARVTASTTTTAVIPAYRISAADWVGETIEINGDFRTISSASAVSGGHEITFASVSTAPAGPVRVLRLVRGNSDTIALTHDRRGGWTKTEIEVVTP